MTTTQDIGTLLGEWAAAKSEADRHYARKKEFEFQIIAYLRDRYPDEYARMERGIVTTFTAEGVTLSRRREYDTDALRSVIGEEYPAAFKEVVTTKVDGNVVKGLWRDAALAERLAETVLPAVPTIKVG